MSTISSRKGRGCQVRLLGHVAAKRGNDVVGRDGLAMVEGQAIAQHGRPAFCAVGRLEAFGKVRLDIALGVELGQAAKQPTLERSPAEGVRKAGWVERVGHYATGIAEAGIAALLRLRAHGCDEHLVGRRHG